MKESIKILPNDIEAEQAVLGACLIDKEAVASAIEILIQDDFYKEDHKIIFNAISNLFARCQEVDVITVKNEIESIEKLSVIGGIEYLGILSDKVPTTANVEQYINIVKEKSISRNLINMANEIAKLGFDPSINSEQLIDTAEKKIFEITKNKNRQGVSELKELMVISLNNLQDIYNNGIKKGISTGFIDIDRKIGGLRPSELIIIAARPAMGKSAFVLNVATHVAEKENIPVLIFNLEMGKNQLADRIICSEALLDSKKYREGKLNEGDWIKLMEGIEELSNAKIYIDDNTDITISKIRSICRKMKIDKQIGLIVIDYLQLITPSNNKGNREQEVAEISRSLKLLAKELEIPVIALAQLSRSNEKRAGKGEVKIPMLSDLRDSGSIEQDADIVMFIHREEYYNATEDNHNMSEIIISKNRSGETGTVELGWLGEYTKFVNFDKYR